MYTRLQKTRRRGTEEEGIVSWLVAALLALGVELHRRVVGVVVKMLKWTCAAREIGWAWARWVEMKI